MLTRVKVRQAEGAWAARAKGALLIRAENVCLNFDGKSVLDHVTVDVRSGEIVTVIGPNGAGKTTLARVLLGLAAPDQGRIERAPGLTVGYVPQTFAIDPILPLTVRAFMGLSTAVHPKAARAALKETGADGLLLAQLSELSGGEFQRVLIARAIARDPDLLVLDEPAKAVDYLGAAQVYDLIAEIRDNRGCGVLLISHDLHIVLGATDRVVCLNRHVCCEGKPDAVAEHPEYVRLFGRDVAKSFSLYAHRHDHCHTLHGEVVEGTAVCGTDHGPAKP